MIHLFSFAFKVRIGREFLDQVPVIPDPWRMHSLNASYGLGSPPEVSKYYQTHNKQGFKYPRDILEIPEENTIRVFALGGSTLYGWGAEGLPEYGNHRHLANDETITHFLEKIINQRLKSSGSKKRVEVINAGIPDYSSAHHLAHYNQSIYRFNPNLVIFVDGNNEFYGCNEFNPMKDLRNTGVSVVESFNERRLSFVLYSLSRYVSQYMSAARGIEMYFMNKWQSEVPPLSPQYSLPESYKGLEELCKKRAKTTYLRFYTQLKAAANFLNGAEIQVFLQPQMMLEDPNYLSESDLEIRKHVIKSWESKQGEVTRSEFMKKVRLLVPRFMKEAGIEFYDVATPATSGGGKGKERIYIDYTHVTPKGAEVTANNMAPHIWPKIAVLAGIKP
jgi:hypothetical protein